MSTASRLGYDGEKPVLDLFNAHDRRLWTGLADTTDDVYYRPRAGHPQDKGDIIGLPYVVSCKNWGSVRPAQWTADMRTMCANAGKETGIVTWKRRGKADPRDWFVLTTLGMFLPFHDAYLGARSNP